MADMWRLEFIDPDRPQGQRWLGCCFVRVPATAEDQAGVKTGLINAVNRSHELGINPRDCAVQGERTNWAEDLLPEEFKNVLLNKYDIRRLHQFLAERKRHAN